MTPLPINTLKQSITPKVCYVAIGNSDDKLLQRQWVCFQLDVRRALRDAAVVIHGDWHSFPDSIYQNACFCFEIDPDKIPEMKGILAAIAVEYKQDSIAWVEAGPSEFLGPKK